MRFDRPVFGLCHRYGFRFINGDGYADAIVGAYGADAGGTNRGQAYVYYGGAVMDATADVTMSGTASGDRIGGSVD